MAAWYPARLMTAPEYDYDLICIGSGPSGQRAAVQAAKLGKKVAVIEKLRITGGVCVDTGTIPSKTFREAVISFTGYGRRFIPHRGQSGGVKATARELFEGVSDVVACEADIVERQLARNGIDLIRGLASFEGPHEIRIQGERDVVTKTAAYIVIAVGTRPAPIPIEGLDPKIVMTSDGVLQIEELPRTMTVVGGGRHRHGVRIHLRRDRRRGHPRRSKRSSAGLSR